MGVGSALRGSRSFFRGFRHVAPLRADRQGPPGWPQGQPLEYQDQAAVSAKPAERYADVGRARPLGQAAHFGKRPEVGRPSRRSRRLPEESEKRRAFAEGAQAQEPDREEAGGSRLVRVASLAVMPGHVPGICFSDYRFGLKNQTAKATMLPMTASITHAAVSRSASPSRKPNASRPELASQ